MSQRGMLYVNKGSTNSNVGGNRGAQSTRGGNASKGSGGTNVRGGFSARGRRMAPKNPEARTIKEGAGTHIAQNTPLGAGLAKSRGNGCPPGGAASLGASKDKYIKQKATKSNAKLKRDLDSVPMFLIEHVQFNLYSTKEIDEEAVVTVNNTDYRGSHSVNDPEMGIFGSDTRCSRCHLGLGQCSGHLGKINLPRPIYHPLAVREITRVLNCVCSCGGLLIDIGELRRNHVLNLRGHQRLIAIEQRSKDHGACQENIKRKDEEKRREKEGESDPEGVGKIIGCSKNPIYVQDKTYKNLIRYKFPKSGKSGKEEDESGTKADSTPMNIDDVLKILQSISMEDARVLGFSNGAHPANMIMERLPVVPPCARNMIKINGQEQQDQLTIKYASIVKVTIDLAKALNEGNKNAIDDLEIRLFTEISELINKNETSGEGKVFQSFKLRLQGKEAAIRSSLMGKRVNFSARTVISPDPSLKFGQIRIPEVMAPFITVPMRVTQYNTVEILNMLTTKTGPIPIRSFVKGSGPKKDEEQYIDGKNPFMPEIGDTVNRWLRNGDYVVFNRQPTLHKYGMMSFQVILGKPYTIGLHLSYVTPFNADFDGDEGNLHLPQLLTAYAEMAELMNVKNCIMNAQQNKPIMGAVYDSLSGAYKMTQDNVIVDPTTFDDCLTLLVESGYTTNKPDEDDMLDLQFSTIQRASSNLPREYGSPENTTDPDTGDPALEFEDRLRLHNMHTYVYERIILEKSTDGLRTYERREEVQPKDVLSVDYYILSEFTKDEDCQGVDKDQEFQEDQVEEIAYMVTRTYNRRTRRSTVTRSDKLTPQEADRLQQEEHERYLEISRERDANFRRKVALGGEQKEVGYSEVNRMVDNDYEPPTFERFTVLKGEGREKCKLEAKTKLVWAEDPNVLIHLRRRISGKALFSMLLPPTFNYEQSGVVIVHGILIKGTIKKKHIGTEHNSIIQVLWNSHGQVKTVDFLTNAPFIISRWLVDDPLTMGIADCSLNNPVVKKDIDKAFAEGENKVLAAGVEPLGSEVEERQRELKNLQYLDVQTSLGTSVPEKAGMLSTQNNYFVMVESGGKGSISNIVQIVGGLGQQYVTINGQNERIPLSITGKTRALPHFPSNSADPRARGFVISSFTKGLTMAETVFHSTGGREGLLDTATKTAETGSMHHRILKSLESIKINHVGAVVDHNGRVIQQVYGADGMNPSKLEKAVLPTGEEVTTFIRLDRVVDQINAKPRGSKFPGFENGFFMLDPDKITTIDRTFELPENPEEKEIAGLARDDGGGDVSGGDDE